MTRNNIKKLIYISLLSLFFAVPSIAADYTIANGTSTFDGSTDCGGSACTKNDTIIIDGGTRGGILFKNLDGVDGYITVTNDPDDQVILDESQGGISGTGMFDIRSCNYVNFQMDNNASYDCDTSYSNVITNGNDPQCGVVIRKTTSAGGSIVTTGDNDYIKISYFEIYHESSSGSSESGIQIQSGTDFSGYTAADTVVLSNFEIHHNYIHDTRYAGMYLGNNDPDTNDNPYLQDFNVHDNYLKDLGEYGITLKGSKSGTLTLNANIVDTTGVGYDGGWRTDSAFFYFGLKNNWLEDTVTSNITNNYIFNSYSYGIGLDSQYGGAGVTINVSGNTIVNPGTGYGGDATAANTWCHGIVAMYDGSSDYNIYDNAVVRSNGYGIQVNNTAAADLDRNIICDWALTGDADGIDGGTLGTGNDANMSESDCADVGFKSWDGDSNYSDDDFDWPYVIGLNISDGDTGLSNTVDATWTNASTDGPGCAGVDTYYECPKVGDLDTQESTDGDCSTTSIDFGTLGDGTECTFRVDVDFYDNDGAQTKTGEEITFTTTTGPPQPSSTKVSIKYSPNGGNILHSPSAGDIK